MYLFSGHQSVISKDGNYSVELPKDLDDIY